MIGSLLGQFKYGKIELQDGTFIEGKNLNITDDKIIIRISSRKIKTFEKSEINSVWKGMPTTWELYKLAILGTVAGAVIGNSQSTVQRGTRTYENPAAWWFVPLGSFVGLIGDKIKLKNKIRGITKHWQLVWKNTEKKSPVKGSNSIATDKYEELETLYELKEKGIITNKEYEKKKAQILELD